jgi:trimethylamine--corrinoid protein Co-methyltransferase
MAGSEFPYPSPQFTLLTERQMQDLHLAALEVLRRIGVRFHHAGALELLRKAGAFVSEGNLVRFPAHLVKDALASAPERIVMCDRDGQPTVFLEGTRCYFGTGSDSPYLIDPYSGEHRPFTRADLAAGYRLCDALPNIHFVMSIGLPSDVPGPAAYDVQLALMLEHTTKPIVFVTGDLAGCRRAIAMAAAAAGGLPALVEQQHILLYSEPSSPLQQSETALEKLLLMAETGLPVVHSPGPQMGATAPITLAGGLAMSLAEVLSSLVVHQLARPGAPFVCGVGLHHMDMKSAQICYGSPEFQLTKAAVAQMGRWYGLPTWGYAACSDAKLMDEQAALEAMLSVTMARLSGANLIHDVGYLESGLCASFELIVLADELIAMTEPLMQGIHIDAASLLIDELQRVGPGGHFLNADSTLECYRQFWYPSLLDRRRRHQWVKDGEPALRQRLNRRVRAILANHQARSLAPAVSQRIRQILAEGG